MAVRAETQINLARVDDGAQGPQGADGTTFTPSVDSAGNISWTNDGGKPNPPTQNIMGPSSQYFWYESSGADAGAHITEIPQEEWQDPSDPNYHSGGNLLAKTNEIAVRDGMTNVATFGVDGAQIGQDTEAHITITDKTLTGVTNGTVETFEFNADGGVADVSHRTGLLGRTPCTDIPTDIANPLVITADMLDNAVASSNVKIILHVYPNSTDSGEGIKIYAQTFKKDGTTQQDTIDTYVKVPAELTHRYLYITYNGIKTISIYRSANFNYDSIKLSIEYITSDNAPTFSFGGENTITGGYSSALGYSNTVSGNYSHADGLGNWAYGYGSHAEGIRSDASGDYSHAQGYWTEAAGTAQTVVGKYNDNDINNALEIGNGIGTGLVPRSNALSVTWNGDITTAGTLTMENHSTPIGWYNPISNTVSKATGTSFASISGSAYTPTAGRYIVTASARFSGATSGNRGVCIYQAGNVVDNTQVLVPAIQSASWSTDLHTTGFFVADGSTEFRIGLLQNSGSSLSTSYTLTFIMIR